MLEYIKKQIADRVADQEFVSSRDDYRDDEAIVEYAHMFQELDDISVEGTNEESDRPIGIDIPLEDDIEVDTIEMNLKDGRVTDVPMDATVQEYLVMKTYDDFYQEACSSIPRMPREYDTAYENRLHAIAHENFDRYQQYVIQEGLFGFGLIKLSDDRVPAKAALNLGPLSDKDTRDYITQLPLVYEVQNNKITKKQLDTALIINSISLKNIAEVMCNIIKSYSSPDMTKEASNVTEGTVWKIATPTKLYVPIKPTDRYFFTIRFEIDMYKSGETNVIGVDCSMPIKGKNHNIADAANIKNTVPELKVANNIDNMRGNYMSRQEALAESYIEHRPVRDGFRFFQEAIDFGEGDNTTPPEGSSAPDSEDDAPTVSGGDSNPGEDSEASDEKKVTVDTNDVSDQIVDKVSNATATEDDGDDTLTPTEPEIDDASVEDTDTKDADDTPSTGSVDIDNELDSLDDNTDSTDVDTGDASSVMSNSNIDNMTIDELLKQGSEKLKGMTINQLRSFINDGAESKVVQQEAFFLTTKNINSELDVHLRNALGILNSDELNIETLIDTFKKEGKKLNRVLTKASKMKKMYTDEERKDISILNKCLVDLMTTLKMSRDANYTATVKRLIQAFTSQSKVVGKIIDSRKPKTVSESYDIDSLYDEIVNDR